ncbi:hypothetical protein [Streptococcus hyointestinalis]|nr:hypothetical protein [Streptococcus hyointestinalis]
MKNNSIDLFGSTDSREQYYNFINLASDSYDKLKQQIETHFTSDNKSELMEYKINILAEAQCRSDDFNVLGFGYSLFLPAAFSYIALSFFSYLGKSGDQLSIESFSPLLFGLWVFVSIIFRVGKIRRKYVNRKKALLFLENFEIY